MGKKKANMEDICKSLTGWDLICASVGMCWVWASLGGRCKVEGVVREKSVRFIQLGWLEEK